MNGGSLEC